MESIPKEISDVLIYYAAALSLGLAFFFWRKPRRGMRLRFGFSAGQTSQKSKNLGLVPLDGAGDPADERNLNIFFNYNGHSWDAYEVLGVPAGASLERVEQGLKSAKTKAATESWPFLEAAFAAIANKAHKPSVKVRSN